MCILSYTSYKGCGCTRKHATLPCPRAFYKELLQCDPRNYELANEVEGDCPECKPAFDNKSGAEPLVTSTTSASASSAPKPQKTPPVYHPMSSNLRQMIRDNLERYRIQRYRRPQRKVMQEVHPEHPGPTSTTSTSASSPPEPKDAPRGSPPMSSKLRQMIDDSIEDYRIERYRIERHRRRQRGFITPPPIPTPPTTVERTWSVPVTDYYTFTTRHYIFSADQREALRRSGRHNLRRLSVISRSPKRSSHTSNSEHVQSTRHVNLSASQRAALARRGRGNIRKLTIVGH